MIKLIMFIPFHLWLKPLILRNYKLRARGDLTDEWYWADLLAARCGHFVR